MKKSQTLAALALAFALGVVAPVAGLIASEGAYAVEYAGVTVRTTLEATGAEVQSAINFVKSNPTYNKIAAVREVLAKYPANAYNLGTPANTMITNIKNSMDALNNAYVNGVSGDKIVASYSNSDDLGEIANKAASIANFAVYSNFEKHIAATPFDIEAVKADVRQMNNLGITNVNISSWGANGTVKTLNHVKTQLNFSAGDYTGIANYTDYADLVGYVNKVANYREAYEALTSTIGAALKEGSTALDNVSEFTTTITTIRGLASDTNIDGYTNWAAVYTAVDNAQPYSTQATTTNYTNVLAIASAWAVALPDNDNSDAVIAEVMMGYKGGASDEDNTGSDNTGSDSENKGDEEKDPAAPGTGIVSTAEGNAATTVSIVAGLATALTALGAGVVAYRNARRSSEK